MAEGRKAQYFELAEKASKEPDREERIKLIDQLLKLCEEMQQQGSQGSAAFVQTAILTQGVLTGKHKSSDQ